MRVFLLLVGLFLLNDLSAQRVLLFEKLTVTRSERLYEGDPLRFKLKGDKFWQEGYIREMRPDIQALVINDRFIMLDEIAVVHRGSTLAAGAGYGLITFGLGWSVWGLLGYNLDDDPDTQYSTGDLLVTATAAGLGYGLVKLLGQRRFRTGKYKRLRIVDLNF